MNLSPNPAVNYVSVSVTVNCAGSIPFPSLPSPAKPLLPVMSQIKELIQLKINQILWLFLL